MPQANNWSEVKSRVLSLVKATESIPAPPSPNEEWSNKMNQLNRCVHGILEQVNSEVEQEDLRAEDES